MDSRISDLLGIVREEINLYRDLIEHARSKTVLLVQGRVDALLESNKIDDTFNLKLRILEDEVARLCSDLSLFFGIPREEFTLLKLAEGLEQSAALEIKSLTGLFKQLVSQLNSVSQRNRKLIEHSVNLSRSLLDFISNGSSSYQQTGLFKPISAIQTTYSHRA
jgi:hypothetical protein